MNTLTTKRSWKSRLKYGLAATMFAFSYAIAAVGPLTQTVLAAAGEIDISLTQGQNSDGTWTSGNTTQYKEGDTVNYRFTLTSSTADATGDMVIVFGSNKCTFFDDYFKLISYTPTSVATVTAPSPPVSVGDDYRQTLSVDFNQASSVVVEYQVRLSLTAGECDGSSSHMAFDNATNPGDFGNIGNRTIPSPSDVWILPSLTINKQVVDGTAVASDFSVAVTAPGGSTTNYSFVNSLASNKNGTVFIDNLVTDGQYTLVETDVNGTYTMTSWSGTNCALGSLVTRTLTATVQAGSDSTIKNASCTFVNSQKKSGITIIKDADPNEAQDFAFTAGGQGVTNFSLDDDDDLTLSNTKTFSNLVGGGTYTFTETAASGWDLTNLVCNPLASATVNLATRTVSITTTPGQNVSCTFTNTKRGNIVVQKVTDPVSDTSTAFTFDPSWSESNFDLTNGQSANSGQLVPGTYNVSELAETGWSLTDSVCSDGSPITAIVVGAGETVTCTFTNTKLGQISIVKNAIPNAAQDFAFTSNVAGAANFNLDDDNNASLENTRNLSGLLPGTYTFTETATEGWDFDGISCNANANVQKSGATVSVTIVAGENVTCTYTNKMHGQLIVRKATFPAGNEQQFSVTASSSNGLIFGGATKNVTDATDAVFGIQQGKMYSVVEKVPDGWTLTSNNCQNKLVNGDSTLVEGVPTVYCDIVNTKLAGFKITKQTNPDGDQTSFDFVVTTGQTPATFSLGDGQSETLQNLMPGQTVTVDETSEAGWQLTDILCDTRSITRNVIAGTVTYVPVAGQNAECIFTNTKYGSISGVKWNDLNGDGDWDSGLEGALKELPLSGWTINLSGTNMLGEAVSLSYVTGSNESPTGTYSFANLLPGLYTITETNQLASGWTQTSANPAPVNLAAGATVQNVNFGNQARGTLKVVKQVDTDGDDEVDVTNATDWEWGFDAKNNFTTDQGNLKTGSSAVTVAADQYKITEEQKDNYHFTSVSCTRDGQAIANVTQDESFDVTVGAGDDIVCTYVNTRDTAMVTVTKEVIKDDGGLAEVDDFDLYVDEEQVMSGVAERFNANESYTITEKTDVTGYTQTSLTCWLASDKEKVDLGDTFELDNGQNVNCKIVNDDIAPKLKVIKVVENGETEQIKISSDFTMNVYGTNVSESSFDGSEEGTTVTLDEGNYSVSEDQEEHYAMYLSDDCEGYIAVGQEKTCTVTNKAAEIYVEKSGPTQAHEGETVVYQFEVTNTGLVPLSGLEVEDDIAGLGEYQFGDTNTNGYLDLEEEWVYNAEYIIPEDQVKDVKNTVTVCADYGPAIQGELSLFQIRESQQLVCDEDEHTLDVLHPSLIVEKTGPANLQLGNEATYTFTVTNTGDTPLDLTKVLDDLAGKGTYVSGDTDKDSMLDLTETWVYTASYTPTAVGNVVNTVEVCAEDELKKVVCDKDDHTTIVYVPQVLSVVSPPQVLQDTGTPLSFAWIASGMLIGLAFLTQLYTARMQKWFAAMRAGFAQPFSAV